MSVVSIVKWSKCLVELSYTGWWLTNQLTPGHVEKRLLFQNALLETVKFCV